MTRLAAQRNLRKHGRKGNWRLKGLLLAAFEKGASSEDYAKAWPSTGKSSDYRFLSAHPVRDAGREQERKVVAEKGEDHYRLLNDFASEDGMPKTLSASKPTEIDDRTLGSGLDDAIKRTLFASSTNEEVNTLFRDQLLETVMEGARMRQIARDVADVINADTKQGSVPIAQDDTSAPRTGEGAEIRDDGENYTTIDWNTTKVAKGSRVTDEMVDHAMIDIIERQVQYTGRAVENAINRIWLTKTIDNADADNDVTMSSDGYGALNEAYGQVDDNDFIPSNFVTTPTFRTELYSNDALRFAQRAGTDDVVRERTFDPLLDMEHVAGSSSSYDSEGKQIAGGGSETWDFSNTGDVGAVVMQEEHNHLILYAANGEDIEVKDYEDPVRDLQGFNARIWADMDYSQARSASRVLQA